MASEDDYTLSKKGNCPRMSAKLRKFLLRYREFEWFEVIKHNIYFYLKDGTECKIRGLMCEAKRLIDIDLFISPHESFVVCRLSIKKWAKNKDGLLLRLISGKQVPATRKMKKECKALVKTNATDREQNK